MRVNQLWLLGLLPFACVDAADKVPLPADPSADPAMVAAGFLDWHPDLRFRLLGVRAMGRADNEQAFKYFQRAAYYADKPSQAMVAEMLWNGRGAAEDHALAYAWMDLAAERGYGAFLGLRERYWKALGTRERARALEVGRGVYARYGDFAAKPRIASQLGRGRMQVTGSRTGFVGNLKIYAAGPNGGSWEIDGNAFYDPRFWNPDKYQQWQDAMWRDPRIGHVSLGRLEQVDRATGPTAGPPTPETAQEPETGEPERTDP
jgi:uncharacterized protein